MTHPLTTAPDNTARLMHAAEMRGQDMQDAPERIWAVHHGWQVTLDGNVQIGQWKETAGPYGGIQYTRTDLCITDAECQRRIDAAVAAEIANASVIFEQAVAAEREACAIIAQKFDAKRFDENYIVEYTKKRFDVCGLEWERNHALNIQSKDVAAAIRARGQK